MDSKELLEMLKAKDQKAISDLYDKYAPALYGIILRMVKSQSKAEAILEQTFLKVLQEVDTYHQGSSFFTWMCSIARNLVDRPSGQWLAEKSDGQDSSIAYRLKRDYEGLLENLDRESREVLSLIYFQGHSMNETSELLGIPLDKVKIRFKSAFDSLRSKFQLEGKILFNGALFMLLIQS